MLEEKDVAAGNVGDRVRVRLVNIGGQPVGARDRLHALSEPVYAQQVPAAALARSVARQDLLGTNPGPASLVFALDIRAAFYEPSRRRETAVPVSAGRQAMHRMQN